MTAARTVVVTDGDQRAALAIVRSLGRAGFRCITISTSGCSLAGASRYSIHEALAPDPLTEPEAFAAAMEELSRRESPSLVVPVGEAAMLALLPIRRRLEPAIIPFGELETFRRLSDKAALLDLASELGIAVPAQCVVASPAAARQMSLDRVRYPIVLKPARSIGEHAGERRTLRVAHAATAVELRDVLDALPAAAYPLLLQQRVVGPGVGIFLLRWNDAIVASFAHRRLREKPPSGGVSVYRESVVASPDLLRRSESLLDSLGWRGVAMIEYKMDAATGVPYLMEINGRFWGSLQLAIDAGVDFPRLLAACALGEQVAPRAPYRRVRSRWWWGEVDHVVTRLRHSSRQLHLAEDTPSLARTLYDFVASPLRPRDREEVFRPGDPLPFVRESRQWFRPS